MSTVITGASGHLGRLVVEQLLSIGTPPEQIVATGRDVEKLADLAQRAVTVRRADFADPTSLVNASTARMTLAEEHRRTEDYLRAGGSAFVILRSGWYLENYTNLLPMITQYHALPGSAQDGLVSGAARHDLAAAAAAVLTQNGHLGATPRLPTPTPAWPAESCTPTATTWRS